MRYFFGVFPLEYIHHDDVSTRVPLGETYAR